LFSFLTIWLLLLAAIFILAPLLRANSAVKSAALESRQQTNVSLYNERIRELNADLLAGNLDQEQFDSLQLDLQQNLLADLDGEENFPVKNENENCDAVEAGSSEVERRETPSSAPGSTLFVKLVPLVMLALMPVCVYALYAKWGFIDEVKVVDLYQQAIHGSSDPIALNELILSFREVVQQDKDNAWAWYYLGKSYSSIGMRHEAEAAYKEASFYMDNDADRAMVLSQYILAKYINADRVITEEIDSLIKQAQVINPNDYSILRILALDAQQRKDYPGAIGYWRDLIRFNPNSSASDVLRTNIAQAQQIVGASDASEPAATEGPTIEITVSLAPDLQLSPNLRLFVAARNADRDGMPPLAAVDSRVGDLPTTILLDDNSAVGPFNLSSANNVFISALVSNTGAANPQPGDYRTVSESFSLQNEKKSLELTIAEKIP